MTKALDTIKMSTFEPKGLRDYQDKLFGRMKPPERAEKPKSGDKPDLPSIDFPSSE